MIENKNHIRIKVITNIFLICGFIGALLFPSIQKGFSLIPIIQLSENRKLAEKPEFKIVHLDPFPLAYETYYSDNFSLRNHLITLKSLLGVSLLRQSPMPDKVIVGKDNWLFTVKDELDQYTANNLLTETQLKAISREMGRRKNYLDQQNIQMYFVIAPSKYTIYPEYLPAFTNKLNKINRTDQVVECLTSKEINVLDLRQPLINAKKTQILFYKTDNHWNPYGGFLASSLIIERIKKDFPQINDLSLDDYFITQVPVKGGNAARMLNLENKFDDISFKIENKGGMKAIEGKKADYPVPAGFPYPWDYELVYDSGIDSLPNILVIRDSFGGALIPFLSQNFNRSVYIFDNWNYTLNEPIITNEKPDIVIYLVFEALWDGFLIGVNNSTN